MKQENKCLGLRGFLFGHKYKTIFKVEPNPPTADEAQQMIKNLSTQLSPLIPGTDGYISSFSKAQRAEEIKSYNQSVQNIIAGDGKEKRTPLYDICLGCGHKIMYIE